MKPASCTVRFATVDDAPALRAILAPIVETSAINFYEAVPSVLEMAAKIETGLRTHPWLVAITDEVVGYAAASRFRPSEGTRWGAETSISLSEKARGQGIGRRLYRALLEVMRLQGFCNAYAGITLPNPASVRLHESLGFRPVGVFHATGFKLGRWHDSGWWELALRPHGEGPPAALRSIEELRADPRLAAVLAAPDS